MEENFTFKGIVTGCLWLDLHEMPSNVSRVIECIPCLTEVRVNLTKSNAYWYYVMADIQPCAVMGYCPKGYIALV